MSIPMLKADLTLKNFFIFNSSFGPKEGEEEKKILFYLPHDVDIDSKVKDVGLCEAIIKFSNTFTNDESVHATHTLKTCQLYYQPEPGYWMVMILNVPFERKTRDTGDYKEYRGDDVHDTIYQAVLRQSYRMFRMFHGTFTSNLCPSQDLDAIANLIGKLEQFYGRYLVHHLQLSNCDVLDAFGSVQYLPLTQLLFLRVRNFINMIEATFEPIKHCVFLYDDYVIWSGLNPTDLYTIYEYLNGPMYQDHVDQKGAATTESTSRPVHIQEDSQSKQYQFMVCRKVQHITLCLFLDGSGVENDEALYNELNAVINPQLTSVSSEISLHLSQQQQLSSASGDFACTGGGGKDGDKDTAPRYIYFNELNRHYRGTLRLGATHQRNRDNGGCASSIPTDVMNLIVDLLDDTPEQRYRRKGDGIDQDDGVTVEESIVKTHNDYWIVKRTCNSRHVFIILNKSSTLIDVSEETRRLLDQNMKGMFF